MRKAFTLLSVAMAAAATWLPARAIAQSYPTQPIKMIVSFGVGGGSDIVSRIIAQRMQEKLGQPVVVENRTGSGGMIGNEIVANAPKDGYTIANMSAAQIITATLTKQMRFHPIDAFDPIILVAEGGLIVSVRPDFQAKSIKELIELARSEPDKLIFASPGFGGTQHLAAEWFSQLAGIKMRHVPFRTSPEAMTALLSRQADVLFETVTAVIGQVDANEVRALAVTGRDRFPAVPTLPTVIEAGPLPGYDVSTWYGFFGPKGMPPAIVSRLNAVMNEIIREREVGEKLVKIGVLVKGSTPQEFDAHLRSELAKWNAVREKANLPQK